MHGQQNIKISQYSTVLEAICLSVDQDSSWATYRCDDTRCCI